MTVKKKSFWGFVGAALVMLMAIFLSVVAGWFSVVGMMAIFSATATSVAIMMIGLETAKVIASCCLKYVTGLNRLMRMYLYAAVVVLMAITALGVYGHLAKGHLEQEAPLAPLQLEIAQHETRLQQLEGERDRLVAQEAQINQSIANLIGNSENARDARFAQYSRNRMTRERTEVQERLAAVSTEINGVNDKLVPLKVNVNTVETKLGPLQYVADLFGWEDKEAAVRLVILLLMFSFDPLAIVLMIVGTTLFRQWAASGDNLPPPPEDGPDGDDDIDPAPEDDGPEPEDEANPEVDEMLAHLDAVVSEAISKAEDADADMSNLWLAADPAIAAELSGLNPIEAEWTEVDEAVTPVEEVAEEVEDEEVEAEEIDDVPPVVPAPKPGTWGYVSSPVPSSFPQGGIIPELEERIQSRNGDEEVDALVEILRTKPELSDEVCEVLSHDDELRAKVTKKVETEWLTFDANKKS